MAKSDRIDNPVIREYLYQFVPEKLNSNSIFVKVFGSKFANKMIRDNVIVAYSNEPYSVRGCSGYHTGNEKSVTFCCPREEMDKLLTPEDISKDEKLQEIAIHECIHAMLERSEKECKLYNISGGTGLLEKYKYQDGSYSEIGRGLNEGFTEWLCEKAGYKTLAYDELTNFIRLIEVAIGTEKTMELGKGGTQYNFPNILNMTKDDVNYLLAMGDQVYNTNDRITTERNLIKVIQNYHDSTRFAPDFREKSKIEYDACSAIIDQYMQDPLFLNYIKTNQKELTEECLIEYLRDVSIKNYEDQKVASVISFESLVLDRFFIRDLQQVFSNETISDKDFEKLAKINSILNTRFYEIPENIKNLKPPMSVVVFKEEFKKVSERYVKQLAIREAEKYRNGELDIKQFIERDKQLFESSSKLSYTLVHEFSKLVAPEFEPQFLRILDSAYKYSDSEKYMENIAKASIYQLKAADPENGLTTSLIFDKENFFDKYNTKGSSLRSAEDEVKFDFTTEIDDEYEVVMSDFLNLQKEVFSVNPNAKIHIASREIIIQYGDKLQFFSIEKGQLIPMVVENQYDLNFQYNEKTQTQEQIAIAPVKIGFLANMVNKFKRKMNDWRNRGKDNTPDYVDENAGRIIFEHRDESKIDSYRVTDYDERLTKSQAEKEKENENPYEENIQENEPKIEEEK